jgi:hypothetical protein
MPIFNKKWTIINLSTRLNKEEIDKCIQVTEMPSCVEFEYREEPFEVLPWGKSQWPWGLKPWTVVISDFVDPRFPKNGENFVGGSARNRCTVAFIPGIDSRLQFGCRIWHEMIHCMEIDSDQMDKNDRYSFCKWVNSKPKEIKYERSGNSMLWCDGYTALTDEQISDVQAAYYTYLMKLNFPSCFRSPVNISLILKRLLELIKKIFGGSK